MIEGALRKAFLLVNKLANVVVIIVLGLAIVAIVPFVGLGVYIKSRDEFDEGEFEYRYLGGELYKTWKNGPDRDVVHGMWVVMAILQILYYIFIGRVFF